MGGESGLCSRGSQYRSFARCHDHVEICEFPTQGLAQIRTSARLAHRQLLRDNSAAPTTEHCQQGTYLLYTVCVLKSRGGWHGHGSEARNFSPGRLPGRLVADELSSQVSWTPKLNTIRQKMPNEMKNDFANICDSTVLALLSLITASCNPRLYLGCWAVIGFRSAISSFNLSRVSARSCSYRSRPCQASCWKTSILSRWLCT